MNKTLTLLLLLTITPAINAEVFKCTDAKGKTIYQNDPCPSTTRTNTVPIEEIDPDTVRFAQEKLDLQLQLQAERESNRAHDVLLEREVEALERSAYADETRAETERLQAEGQFQGQQDYSNRIYPLYPYFPYQNHNRHNGHRNHDRDHPDHYSDHYSDHDGAPHPPYVKKPGKMSVKIK